MVLDCVYLVGKVFGSVYVSGFELVLTCLTLGVTYYTIILYIIYYILLYIHVYIIYYILLYYYTITIIISYTILFLTFPPLLLFFLLSLLPNLLSLPFFPSFPFFSQSISSSLPFPPLIYLLSFPSHLIHSHPLPILLSSSLPFPNLFPPHSFYTCRYLHILIYIQSHLPNLLTPHVLSEWMVEVCRFDRYGVLF